PEELRVVVRVEVDESGRDDHAAGVERALRRRRTETADARDATVAHADVGAIALRARPVDDDAVPDDDVVVGHATSRAAFRRRRSTYHFVAPPAHLLARGHWGSDGIESSASPRSARASRRSRYAC